MVDIFLGLGLFITGIILFSINNNLRRLGQEIDHLKAKAHYHHVVLQGANLIARDKPNA